MTLTKLKTKGSSKMAVNDINSTGEQLSKDLLKRSGYYHFEKNGAHVLADSPMRKVLLITKTVQHPNKHTPLTKDEISELKERAKNMLREAWVSLVTIDTNGKLVGDIEWINLSKH